MTGPEDIGALAGAMQQRLLGDPELAARLGENARRDVLANKTWEKSCEIVEEVYASVMADVLE